MIARQVQTVMPLGLGVFRTVEATDRGDVDARVIQVEIAASGFAVVTPVVPDRRP